MVTFGIIGHTARTDASFSLNDLPGTGGRMDLLCRAVQASLFLSHGIRPDAVCTLLLCGQPQSGRLIRFEASSVRNLSPDERSVGSFIKKALSIPSGSIYREAAPGVLVKKGSLSDLLGSETFALLDERGQDIRTVEELPSAYLLSDHQNFTDNESELIESYELPRYSLGPMVTHADHAIVLLWNEIDRRRAGWI